jgi:hypothetical protein
VILSAITSKYLGGIVIITGEKTMGLFSLFSKRKPEEIYDSIAKKIVLTALRYRQEISASNNKLSVDAGAEMIYLLLHLVDREAFRLLGAARRDTIFDKVSQIAVVDYTGTVLNADAPHNVKIQIAEQMIGTLNSRQLIYSQCKSLYGESFPCKGTVAFAFSFFVHRALGQTDRNDVNDVLTGKCDFGASDAKDFPTPPEVMQTAIKVGSVVSSLRLQDDLTHIK